jgi:hypothetical protein
MHMRWLLLGALLSACESTELIGANGPDAALLIGDGGADGGGSDGSAGQTCACDASSCGSRICGRSDCGFPCGECAPGTTCFLGASCNSGGGTACVDAFGDRVGVLDRGFRACPSDATKQQHCTCNGGGADDWTSCDATCVEVCTHVPAGIACGTPACDSGDVCCISIVSTSSRACTDACNGLEYTRECDGPEDCTAGSSCCGGSDAWTATCAPGVACGADEQYCHTGDDCPTAKPYCCPSAVGDMRSCSATAAPTCT